MNTVVKEDILKQHKQILMTAGLELATNNTNSLIEDDIISHGMPSLSDRV